MTEQETFKEWLVKEIDDDIHVSLRPDTTYTSEEAFGGK